jgi:hypothetical protein
MGKLTWVAAGVGIGVLGVLAIELIRNRMPGVISGKITPHDPIVRRTAVEIASNHPDEYNIEQALDVFDYMKSLNYVSDPQPDHVALPRDTIVAGGGDCDDFAVTTASLIEAIGGRSRVAVVSNDEIGHAFAELYIGPKGTITSEFLEPIRARYGNFSVAWEHDKENNEWLVFDTLLTYPGMLPQQFAEADYSSWKWLPGTNVRYVYR